MLIDRLRLRALVSAAVLVLAVLTAAPSAPHDDDLTTSPTAR